MDDTHTEQPKTTRGGSRESEIKNDVVKELMILQQQPPLAKATSTHHHRYSPVGMVIRQLLNVITIAWFASQEPAGDTPPAGDGRKEGREKNR